MKVRVSFTLDVDPEAWANEYGVGLLATGVSEAEIRKDVQTYFRIGAQEQLNFLGLGQKEEN